MYAALALSKASLAIILAIAGAGKLADHSTTAALFRKLNIPASWPAKVAEWLIPIVESGLALMLVYWPWSRVACIGAAFFFLFASTAVAVLLFRGVDVNCQCFGALYAERIGKATLVRSLTLGACSATLFALRPLEYPKPSIPFFHSSWALAIWTYSAPLAVALVGVSMFLIARSKVGADAQGAGQNKDFSAAIHSNALLSTRDAADPPKNLSPSPAVRDELLVFLDGQCKSCNEIFQELLERDNRPIHHDLALVVRNFSANQVARGRQVLKLIAFGDPDAFSMSSCCPEGTPAAILTSALNDPDRQCWYGPYEVRNTIEQVRARRSKEIITAQS